MVIASHLALCSAPVGVFWALAGAGACAAALLVWFSAALFVDLVLCPCGRRAGGRWPVRVRG